MKLIKNITDLSGHFSWCWPDSEFLSSDCWSVYENVTESDVYANSSCPINTPGTCDRSLELFYTVLLTPESSELQCQHIMENPVIRGLLIIVALHSENIRAAVASFYTSRMCLTCLLAVFLFLSRCLEWKTGSVSIWSKKTWRDNEDVMYNIRVWYDKLLYWLDTTESRERSGVGREDGCRFQLC